MELRVDIKALVVGGGALILTVLIYSVLSVLFPLTPTVEYLPRGANAEQVFTGRIAPSLALPADSTQTASAGSGPVAPTPAMASPGDAPWWPRRSTPGRLNLLYARQAPGQRAVVLLFDTYFANIAVVSARLRLLDAGARPVAGNWAFGGSRRMLIFGGLAPGRYTVSVAPELVNESGQALGLPLRGTVTVH